MRVLQFVLGLILLPHLLLAEVRLPRLIGDNMVLQRDQPIALWGWAAPAEKVTVSLKNKTYRAVTAANGRWAMQLPAQPAGTGYEMRVKGKNEIRIRNVAFGDVWLCSGQSNMVINMERVKERFGEDIASASYPDIRNFFVPTKTSLNGPSADLPPSEWKPATGGNVLGIGAVSYFFARDLYEKHKVPIGIINSSVGGTPIEAWISEQGYREFPDMQKIIAENKDSIYVQSRSMRAPAAGFANSKEPDQGLAAHWESESYEPKGWRNFNIPGYWEDQGLKGLDGVVWFRREFEIPQTWAGKSVKLFMGRIVDADEVYVNGRKIGGTTYQYPPRRYEIPAGVLKAGKNTFVVRVTNQAGKGGFVPDKPYVMAMGDQQIDLKGTWQYKVGKVSRPSGIPADSRPLVTQNQPAALYNAMVAPVLPMKVKGFVWYQGESNVDHAEAYNALLPALIRDWRSLWKDEKLPFLVVQLPNFQDVSYLPAESDWAVLREAQNKALLAKNTAVIVTIDLGEWNDIHPLNKKDIGKRLALAARNLAYGEKNVIYSGPTLTSQRIDGRKVTLTFDNVAEGIRPADGEDLRWFAVAGDDRKFAWAKASITGKNEIALQSDDVESPKYVRYAWQDNPAGVNFYNSAGLPASPFRTDAEMPDEEKPVQARDAAADAEGDDGYRLWLKYEPVTNAAVRAQYLRYSTFIGDAVQSEVTGSAARELQRALKMMVGKAVPVMPSPGSRQGGIIFKMAPDSARLPAEGYHIEEKSGNMVISSASAQGILYGTFALLRHMQREQPLTGLDVTSAPKVRYRMLNHWDNPDGTIERGYAGSSLWKWYELPERVDPRYTDYARANASLGINGTVLNNVNASARFMSREYIEKVAAIAGVMRRYGIKTYLSVYFAAPKTLGGLPTSDPLDPKVRAWWAEKVAEIYKEIPDFGGFLVKANSEGEPGPQDYGRTHADGANMLAEAFKPYDGIVIWRAFVYKADPNTDRFKAAYEEFVPLDGRFDPKVIVQVKNGPIDFQPREPFSPLFGSMPRTPLGMEFQITQEYLGFAAHAVYEAPIFKECLDADTYVNGAGSTVAKVIDGSLHGYTRTLMAGVANTGSDRNWTGHPLAQANWYAFGRLAWDHQLSAEQIASEWTELTLTRDPQSKARIAALMLRSRDIYVDYNTPLGLSRPWMGVHFAPEPWQSRGARPDWTATYYHRADSVGLGFDRTASGSNALAQYRPQVQQQWNNPDKTALPYLLWFHHVGWNKPLRTGRTLWEELCHRLYAGADSVTWMQQQWDLARPSLDPRIYADVAGRLKVQRREALWWRDAWLLYLQTFSKQPVPKGLEPPRQTLEEVKKSVNVYLIR